MTASATELIEAGSGPGSGTALATPHTNPPRRRPPTLAAVPVDEDVRVQSSGDTSSAVIASAWATARLVLLALSALTLGLVLNIVVGGPLVHRAAQARAYDQLRNEIALGTAPLRPTVDGRPLPLGTPIALLEIPSIGVKEVVGEGTTGPVLMAGPGHLRSTVFPGEAGTSIVLGRAATYGAPFSRLHDLRNGARIVVVTQAGTSTFHVVDLRRAGDIEPHLGPGRARLTLATATGPSLAPSGVLWVDAEELGRPYAAAAPAVKAVPGDERPLGIDTSSWSEFALWSLLLLVVLLAGRWTWRNRGRSQAWVAFTAPTLTVAYFAASHAAAYLPNIM